MLHLIKLTPRTLDKLTEEMKKEISQFDSENILPYVSDPFTELAGVVIDDEKIVAVGINKIVNEFKVIVNPAASKLQISRAIKGLIEEALEDMKSCGSNEVLAVVTQGGEYYQNFLQKHFEFDKVDGVVLKRSI